MSNTLYRFSFSVCSSRKAIPMFERKARKIPLLKEELHKLQSQLHVLSSDVNSKARRAVSEVLQGYTSKGITTCVSGRESVNREGHRGESHPSFHSTEQSSFPELKWFLWSLQLKKGFLGQGKTPLSTFGSTPLHLPKRKTS